MSKPLPWECDSNKDGGHVRLVLDSATSCLVPHVDHDCATVWIALDEGADRLEATAREMRQRSTELREAYAQSIARNKVTP